MERRLLSLNDVTVILITHALHEESITLVDEVLDLEKLNNM